MKRYIILFLSLFLLLCSCQKEETPAYPDRDVDYPAELPDYGEDSIAIHYYREDNSYADKALWLWDPNGSDDNQEDYFNYQDDYGVIAHYPLSHFGLTGDRLGMIVKKKDTWSYKDGGDADRFIELSRFQKDDKGIYHVYITQNDPHIYNSSERIIFDDINTANFLTENTLYISCTNKVEKYRLYENGTLLTEQNGSGRTTFSDRLDVTADFAKEYSVEVEFRETGNVMKAPVSLTGLYNSDVFNDLYYYDGELGALYSKNKTEFRVWSPFVDSISLRLYETGTPKSLGGDDAYTEYPLVKGDKAVWSYSLDGDQEGKYYTYFVTSSKYPEGREVVDPYAYSAGINGLRAMVVDFDKSDPEGWDDVRPLDIDRKALTVYETHVADVTSSDTWGGPKELSRTYKGLIKEGTTYTEGSTTVSTGFDHIKELGVNAMQLLPVFDQANDERTYTFNWGYNPLNYNVAEGMYSSDPYDGYVRMRELKEVVKAFHDEGIVTIMDVVYNHMNSVDGLAFDVLMPNYFFRYKNDGTLSNGSGCGNEVASENAMVRKFIIDSVCFWTEEYKFGGFRFDLMGLHDIETMNEVVKAVREIDPGIVIYGEPWTGGGTTLPADDQAIQANANKFEGYGQFNDQMRDALIKGGLNDKSALGWVTGTTLSKSDLKAIEEGIKGYTYNAAYQINDPDKTVNYVTCHDNYTLYDRIKAAGIEDEDTVKKMAMLANSVVFTSNGTTFMLGGEEFLRTKQGDSNSYKSPDSINNFDYSLKIRNLDLFENYQKLISFKQEMKALQGDGTDITVEEGGKGEVLKVSFSGNGKDVLILHNNGVETSQDYDVSGYGLYLNTLDVLDGNEANVTPLPYQTLIYIR